jgi:hypothetical protein
MKETVAAYLKGAQTYLWRCSMELACIFKNNQTFEWVSEWYITTFGWKSDNALIWFSILCCTISIIPLRYFQMWDFRNCFVTQSIQHRTSEWLVNNELVKESCPSLKCNPNILPEWTKENHEKLQAGQSADIWTRYLLNTKQMWQTFYRDVQMNTPLISLSQMWTDKRALQVQAF